MFDEIYCVLKQIWVMLGLFGQLFDDFYLKIYSWNILGSMETLYREDRF